jgi:hypothetical protein
VQEVKDAFKELAALQEYITTDLTGVTKHPIMYQWHSPRMYQRYSPTLRQAYSPMMYQ